MAVAISNVIMCSTINDAMLVIYCIVYVCIYHNIYVEHADVSQVKGPFLVLVLVIYNILR